MDKQEQKQKQKKDLSDNGIVIVDTEKKNEAPAPKETAAFDPSAYISFLNAMKNTPQTISSAPTDTPKNWFQSIRFYDDGTDRRIYFYFNGVWSYTALT